MEPSVRRRVELVIEAWNRMVAREGKGLRADVTEGRDLNTAAGLLSKATGLEQIGIHARIMFREKWRDPAYLSLKALLDSWESLQLKADRFRYASEPTGNPPTPIEKVKEAWQGPKMDPALLKEWIERNR